MELKVDIPFDQLVEAIQQLPEDKIIQLKEKLSAAVPSADIEKAKTFKDILLHGPVMTDEQYNTYKHNRDHFNKWRIN